MADEASASARNDKTLRPVFSKEMMATDPHPPKAASKRPPETRALVAHRRTPRRAPATHGPAPPAPQVIPSQSTSSSATTTQPAPSPQRNDPNSTKPPTAPWRIIKDPMLQSSYKPRRADQSVRGMAPEGHTMKGIVVSPTNMIALPFGSMIELANVYPDDGVTVISDEDAGAEMRVNGSEAGDEVI